MYIHVIRTFARVRIYTGAVCMRIDVVKKKREKKKNFLQDISRINR